MFEGISQRLPAAQGMASIVYPYQQGTTVVYHELKKSGTLNGTLFLFGADGCGFQEPRVQMVRGYGFHIIAVENGRFRRNSVCCGPVHGLVTVRFTIPG